MHEEPSEELKHAFQSVEGWIELRNYDEVRRNCSHLAKIMEAHLDKKLSLKATESGVEQLYTIKKVADALSVDEDFVHNLIKTKAITSIKLDENTIRIPAGSLERYLLKLRVKQ